MAALSPPRAKMGYLPHGASRRLYPLELSYFSALTTAANMFAVTIILEQHTGNGFWMSLAFLPPIGYYIFSILWKAVIWNCDVFFHCLIVLCLAAVKK